VTPVLRVKEGVKFDRISPAGFKILSVLQNATYIFDRDLVITCGTEGHPPTDPHTEGSAFDIRALNMAEATVLALVSYLKTQLGPRFTVLYEAPTPPSGVLASVTFVNPKASAPHFHIQRKAGTEYPPNE
jgi:hypothetical protein